MILYTAPFESPFGTLITAVDETGTLCRLILPNGHDYWAREIDRHGFTTIDDAGRNAVIHSQLDEYFEHKRRQFEIPLRTGGSPFQQKVWTALTTIPYGATISYKQLAEQIGNLAAIRAVGRANGQNPIPIVIPCHRVIGADGSLTGFGGGLPLKEALLTLEGVRLSRQERAAVQPMLL